MCRQLYLQNLLLEDLKCDFEYNDPVNVFHLRSTRINSDSAIEIFCERNGAEILASNIPCILLRCTIMLCGPDNYFQKLLGHNYVVLDCKWIITVSYTQYCFSPPTPINVA
jgi:hypothetical protein